RLDLLGCSLVDLSTSPFDQVQFWVELRQQGQAHGHLDIANTDGSQQQIDFRAIADFAPQRHLWVLRHSAEHRPMAAATQNQPPLERPNIPYAAASQFRSQVGSQQVNSPLPAAHHNLVDEHQHWQPAETVWHNDQHQWQRLFDALPVGVAYINRDGCYGYANQVYQNWFRPSPADIAGQALNVVLGSMGYEHIQPQIDRVLAGEPVTYEMAMPDAAGGTRYVRATLVPDVDERGMVCGFYRFIVDLSDRHQLESELYASRHKYQTLFEILPLGVSITDAAGNLVETNPASEQILGIPTTEHNQRTCDEPTWQIIYPNGDPMPAEDYPAVRALRENQAILDVEQGIIHPDGSIRWIMTSAAPIPIDAYGVAIAYIDITERKRLELQLQSSEERLSNVLENVSASVTRFRMFANHDWEYDYISSGCEVVFGYPPEAFQRNKTLWMSHVFPADQERVIQAMIETVFAAGRSAQDYRFCHADGSVRWISETLSSSWSEDKQCWVVTLVSIDISDRKAAEEALHRSEATNQAILAAIPDLIIRIHRDGTYLQVHRNTGIRLIYPGIVAIGSHISECLPPDMVEERWHYIHRALDTKQFQVYEYTVHFEDETRYEEARIIPMDNDTVLVLVRDISDRKRVEFALRHREQEFRMLAENAPDCIMRCDRQFRYLYVNPTTERLSQMARADIVGKTSAELGFADSLVQLWHGAVAEVFRTGDGQILEYELPLPSGDRTFYSRIVPEWGDDGTVCSVLIVARDITDLKRAQNELRRQAERERLLSTVTQYIRQSLDLSQILTTAVDEIRHLLHADRVLIYQFNSDWSGDMVAESVVAPWHPVIGSSHHDPCFTGALVDRYRGGHISQIDDINTVNLTPCYRDFLASFQIQAALTMSLLDGEQLWGLFCIHYCAAAHSWQAWEVELLQRVVDQVAIAIHQSQLYTQVQTLNANLEQQVQERTTQLQQSFEFEALLNRITERLRNSLDEQRILDAAINEFAEHLNIQFGNVALYNTVGSLAEHDENIVIVSEYNRLSPALSTFVISAVEFPHIQYQVHHNVQFQFCMPLPIEGDRWQTALLSPMVDENNIVLGDILLLRSQDQYFTETEMKLVQQVANQCAIALRQSRLYQSAQNQVTELERLNQLKDDFLSTVSHELRTPMANIKMATELLEIYLVQQGILPPELSLENITEQASPIIRYFHILKDAEEREITLINDLLDLARIDAQTEPLNLTTIALQNWIPHLLEPFLTRTQQQRQQLTVEIQTDIPPCQIDLAHFQRILSELLNNACKYTPAGETIGVVVCATAEWLELKVFNSGVDIPQEECDRIFDRFYRIPNSDPWKHGGTGLGLALVKKLVEYMDGSISVERSPNRIEFAIHLPLLLESVG
ncbi:MAG TPA: PAS domain-containing protein, partial [Chroococcidiopsis sp.]